MPGSIKPADFLATLADRADALARRSLAPWLDVGLDPQGGAYGFLDRTFRPRFAGPGEARGPSGEKKGDQSLVQQSRHLFSYSFMHARRPGDLRVEAMAHEMYAHLQRAFVRPLGGHGSRTSPESPVALARASLTALRRRASEPPPSSSGGEHLARPLWNQVPRGGFGTHLPADRSEDFSIDDPAHPAATQLYAQGFAIYALCNYSLAFSRRTPARQAWELFLIMDAQRHDDEQGGYDQTEDGGWLPFVAAPPGAAKCTNTHIHLLEALTPLCRCLPKDALVRARLLELALFISQRLFQASGYVHKFVTRSGKPVGAPEVSYGHDLETSWLLLDALDALDSGGKVDDERRRVIEEAARKMAEHALRTGWDPAGGVFDSGVPEGAPSGPRVTGHEKIWWAQAEAMPGIVQLYRHTKDRDLLARLEDTFEFLSTKCWDPVGGEYFWGVDSDGNCLDRGDHKGEFWKTPYHALRACILTADWCRAEAAHPL